MRSCALFVALCGASVLSGAEFLGAPEPTGMPSSPATPEEQRRRFTLPPGFEIELVASEEQGVGKPITVAELGSRATRDLHQAVLREMKRLIENPPEGAGVNLL